MSIAVVSAHSLRRRAHGTHAPRHTSPHLPAYAYASQVRKELIDSVAASLDLNVDSIRLAASSWREQMSLAVQFEGESFLSSEGFFYLLSVPWKIICAGIPPPRIANGWVCFSVTLGVIGILTAIIGDLAAHVRHTMGL